MFRCPGLFLKTMHMHLCAGMRQVKTATTLEASGTEAANGSCVIYLTYHLRATTCLWQLFLWEG